MQEPIDRQIVWSKVLREMTWESGTEAPGRCSLPRRPVFQWSASRAGLGNWQPPTRQHQGRFSLVSLVTVQVISHRDSLQPNAPPAL